MKHLRKLGVVIYLAGSLSLGVATATERVFTYSYEPEAVPKGGFELEQTVTLRALRNSTVGQDNYMQWESNTELEYGVTDRYTAALYLNMQATRFRDPGTGAYDTTVSFTGVALENRYQLLNPAEHPVGLSLYFEPRFSGDEAELEQRIILGQRHGLWKWAVNLVHATDWSRDLRDCEGEVELSFGISRQLTPRWLIGLELRDHNELPDYARWENTAVYLGPVVSYRHGDWWVTASVLPQIFGENYQGNPDGNRHLDLEGHEHLNIRVIFGVEF